MKIRVKEDSVEVSGYVNAIERKSKPLMSRMGQFVERICKGAFKRAIERNENIRLLLNHDRDLGGTADGNLELSEDNIGLHAKAKITDPEVIQKARNGDLVGWSFGFRDRFVEYKRDEDGLPLRDVKDLNLEEVSILDRTKTPAYDGTLVSVRDNGNSIFWGEAFYVRHDLESEEPEQSKETEEKKKKEKPKKIDYSKIDRLIRNMKSDKIEEEEEDEEEEDEDEDTDDEVDEIDQKLDELEKELLDDEKETEQRYASKYYDPVKAHEYYEQHKQLKGKKSTSGLSAKGKEAAKYVKQQLTQEKKAKIAEHKNEMNAQIASLREQYKALPKDQRKEVKGEIQGIIKELRNRHKTKKAEIKAEYDKKYEEELSKISGETEMQKAPKSTGKANVLDMAKKAGIIKKKT